MIPYIPALPAREKPSWRRAKINAALPRATRLPIAKQWSDAHVCRVVVKGHEPRCRARGIGQAGRPYICDH
jgi:hypothetical protein